MYNYKTHGTISGPHKSRHSATISKSSCKYLAFKASNSHGQECPLNWPEGRHEIQPCYTAKHQDINANVEPGGAAWFNRAFIQNSRWPGEAVRGKSLRERVAASGQQSQDLPFLKKQVQQEQEHNLSPSHCDSWYLKTSICVGIPTSLSGLVSALGDCSASDGRQRVVSYQSVCERQTMRDSQRHDSSHSDHE